MPYAACERWRALRVRSPWVARLVAPAQATAAREEPPLVDVLDDVLVFGQPRAGTVDVVVEAAGEQHGAGIHRVPAGARGRR